MQTWLSYVSINTGSNKVKCHVIYYHRETGTNFLKGYYQQGRGTGFNIHVGSKAKVQSLQNPIWVSLKLMPHVGKFSLKTPMGVGFARFAELELGMLVEIMRVGFR
ncbi:hypothetical protein LXL04_008858 [Taraxacum kok-saghyz]